MSSIKKSPGSYGAEGEKIMNAIYEGEIRLSAEAEPLSVAVLEDGTRLISRNAIFRAFGRTKRGRALAETRAENLPSFADAKNLQTYMSPELYQILTNPIKCKTIAGPIIDGYKAEVLPLLCDAYLDADKDNILTTPQKPLAVASFAIIRALSKLGIIALIDEATGYQYERERYELQKILNAYISDEILKWQLTFTDEFYKEVYRLWGLPFIPKYIKNKPSFIGKLTTKYIYEQLPEGVLEKIKVNTPKTEKGNWKYKFHQSLTPEIGREHLKKQIIEVTTLMSVSRSKDQFEELFKEKYHKVIQLAIEFNQEPGKKKK